MSSKKIENLEAAIKAIDVKIGKLQHRKRDLEEVLQIQKTRESNLIMRGKTAEERTDEMETKRQKRFQRQTPVVAPSVGTGGEQVVKALEPSSFDESVKFGTETG